MWFTSEESRTLDHCTSVDHKLINMQVISFHCHENNLELLTFNLESNVDA